MSHNFSHTFSWQLFGDILLVCVVPGDIEPARWESYLTVLRSGDCRLIFTLVKGAVSIDANMRSSAAGALKVHDLPVMVITDSRLTRGMLTAMSWLGAKFSPYRWADLDTAVDLTNAPNEVKQALRTAAKAFQEYASEISD